MSGENIDYSKLSDSDLLAIKANDWSKVSDEGLLTLKGLSTPKSAQSDVPLHISEMQKPIPVQEPKTSLLDKVKALYEVPTAIASGMVAQPVGAAYGVYKGITGPKTPEGIDRKSTRLNSSHT